MIRRNVRKQGWVFLLFSEYHLPLYKYVPNSGSRWALSIILKNKKAHKLVKGNFIWILTENLGYTQTHNWVKTTGTRNRKNSDPGIVLFRVHQLTLILSRVLWILRKQTFNGLCKSRMFSNTNTRKWASLFPLLVKAMLRKLVHLCIICLLSSC